MSKCHYFKCFPCPEKSRNWQNFHVAVCVLVFGNMHLKKATWKKHCKKNDPLEKWPLGKLPLEKSPLAKRWKLKTSFYYQYMIVVWHMNMVVQWVSQKFPDSECTPAVFWPYMLIIIFNKSLLKHSLRCSSKLFFKSWNESSQQDLPRRWEEDCLDRRLPDNVFWNKLYRQSFKG